MMQPVQFYLDLFLVYSYFRDETSNSTTDKVTFLYFFEMLYFSALLLRLAQDTFNNQTPVKCALKIVRIVRSVCPVSTKMNAEPMPCIEVRLKVRSVSSV